MFPKKNSFSYPYLVVGVPVGWEGCANGMVSVGQSSESETSRQKGFYHVDPNDFLERGHGHLGLRGKLDEYLRGQGVDPAQYPFAYLTTAARFLGYHFNPVSFWYLYDADKCMTGMILEVNNTFDERRMYFLTPDDASTLPIEGRGAKSQDRGASVMKQKWPKDFHVSPFNSRKGSYSLLARDPLSPSMQGTGPIDNTINLVSSKGHGKLVARLLADGPAIDAYAMTMYQKLVFLWSWWWVGFATFPRIVYQAGVLFFTKKLHVWYRPEPLKETMGRHADSTERLLEPIFRRYLRHLVEQSPAAVAVTYIPGGIPGERSERMLSKAAVVAPGSLDEMEFRVLTPAFYSRFVCYAHDVEAMFCEFRENSTVWISRAELLPAVVVKQPTAALSLSNPIEYACFRAMQALRRRPERIERPLTSSAMASARPTAPDIRGFRISSMDGYVLAHESADARSVYIASVLKLFLAGRIALGSVALLGLEVMMVRVFLDWIMARALDGLVVRILAPS